MQEGEAGGITQQIGATYVPGEAIAARTELLRQGKEFEMKMPGLLIIDTPGSDPRTSNDAMGCMFHQLAITHDNIMHGRQLERWCAVC